MSVPFAVCVCVLGCLLQSSRVAAQSNSSCAYVYTLRADHLSACVRSSLDQYASCSSLSVHLESFNSNSIPTSDCVQFVFEPGLYVLSAEAGTTQVPYSVVLSSAALQTVSVRCLSSDTPITRASYFQSLSFIGGTSVAIDGIDFEGCNGPLQFDRLDSVLITNCSFRYKMFILAAVNFY